ncbi:MAG: 6-phosphogluconolactonase [Acidobacteria bacterium]|nr:6-phosphogluconolactonase [Acidobacteriota bacterium]
MNRQIQIVSNGQELAREAALEFVRLATDPGRGVEIFTVALSGGSTPKSLYSLLAGDETIRKAVPWERVHFFWGDERHVSPDHPESNYRMAHETLLSKIPLPAANVHRIMSENPDARQAAAEYEKDLRKFFQLAEGRFPRFDLFFLGLGPDGHTASLFPGTKALNEERRLVVSNWVGKLDTQRITMTAPLINEASEVIFLVAGDDKAAPLKSVLEGDYEPMQLPAQLVRPEGGRLLWIVDSAAARLLKKREG